jgi:large subunit ribosomal protein L5
MADIATHIPRLKDRYERELKPQLIEQFGYSSPMQAPKLVKITLNMGVSDAKTDSKALDHAIEQMTQISGQKPIGCKVTLRGENMYEFLDRLTTVALPRIRDFRGISAKSFDGRGNYSLGIREQIIFPEIDYDRIDQVRGMDITITTTAATDDEARALLKLFGMPFREA